MSPHCVVAPLPAPPPRPVFARESAFRPSISALPHWLGCSPMVVAASQVMLIFSLGPGPLTFVVVNEMLPLALRGKVVALSLLLNRFASGSIALTFLSLKEAIGVFAAFSLYAGLGLCVTVFYHLCVPNATGKALEDNESDASNGLAAADSAADAAGGAGWASLVDEAPDGQRAMASTSTANTATAGVETPMVRSAGASGGVPTPNYGTSGGGSNG